MTSRYSPVGILEPLGSVQDPPGTCLFDPPVEEDTAEAQLLKRHPKHHEIILRPQPSNSPRDPLNWSRFRKEALFFTLMWGSCCTGVIGPILVPAFGVVSADLDKPIPKIAQLNGILVLFEGIGGLLVIMLSAVFGRRISYLISFGLQFVGPIVGACSKSYDPLWGSRIIQGLGMAAVATLAGTTITDIFYTYEHGLRIALWQVMYLASINLAPIISGEIVSTSNWHNVFWVFSAFSGVAFIASIFVMPETYYTRSFGNDGDYPLSEKQEKIEHLEAAEAVDMRPMNFAAAVAIPLKMHNTDGLLKTLLRPILIILSPNVFYGFLVYTISFHWFVATGATYSQLYAGMVYHETPKAVGYIAGWAPLIGTLLAALLAGPLTDYGAQYLSKKNHGIFEPEYRLIVLIPAFICIAIGGFGWGYTLEPTINPIVSQVFSAFLFAGGVLGSCASIAYANSCFPARGGDPLGIIMLLRSSYIFGATYYLNDWLALQGPKEFFSILSGVTLGIFLLGVPVYVYGKVWRTWIDQSSLQWLVR